jgi:hypothetical protein
MKPNAMVKAGDLHREYLRWAQEQGLSKTEILTSNSFGRRMGRKFEKSHGEHGKRYHGISILTENRSVSNSSPITSSIGKEYKTDQKSVRYIDNQDDAEDITDEDVREFINRLRDKPEGYILKDSDFTWLK